MAPATSDDEEQQSPLDEEPPTTEASEPTPTQAKPAEPLEQEAEAETKLMPSTSLGGSARELLNSDGRLRKP